MKVIQECAGITLEIRVLFPVEAWIEKSARPRAALFSNIDIVAQPGPAFPGEIRMLFRVEIRIEERMRKMAGCIPHV